MKIHITVDIGISPVLPKENEELRYLEELLLTIDRPSPPRTWKTVLQGLIYLPWTLRNLYRRDKLATRKRKLQALVDKKTWTSISHVYSDDVDAEAQFTNDFLAEIDRTQLQDFILNDTDTLHAKTISHHVLQEIYLNSTTTSTLRAGEQLPWSTIHKSLHTRIYHGCVKANEKLRSGGIYIYSFDADVRDSSEKLETTPRKRLAQIPLPPRDFADEVDNFN
jgi:hypothetical protein